MSENEVLADLQAEGNNKAKLMQKYSDKMQAILKLHGGNTSDIPMDPNHEYHKIQHKLTILNRLKG